MHLRGYRRRRRRRPLDDVNMPVHSPLRARHTFESSVAAAADDNQDGVDGYT